MSIVGRATQEKNKKASLFQQFKAEVHLKGDDLTSPELREWRPNLWFIEKWNWDYLEAHEFQLKCIQFIRQHPSISIFIFTNHPHCFTVGRGLQKHKLPPEVQLIDYNPKIKDLLPFPVHDIKRGGGLTFHYPGQFVCYPIVSLNGKNLDVYKLMHLVLGLAQSTLENHFLINGLSHKEELLGLWHKDNEKAPKQKLASIGIAISHYVTYHGMAVNLFKDEGMERALELVFPCGLPGETYTSLEAALGAELAIKKIDLVNQFFEGFLKEMENLWKGPSFPLS